MARTTKDKVVSSFATLATIARKKKEDPAVSNRSESDPLRVALMCPYSMSVPGGVQNQVLLLAREMRARGIDARIIAPCDGAPPVNYLYSVGTTRAVKSNGSLAPITDDASSSSLTLDAINSFMPDVIHLHEPLVPGPTSAAMIGADCAMVATFHAAGQGAAALKYFRHPARGAISRVQKRVCVSDEARKLVDQYLPGEYDIVPNCIDVDHIAHTKKWPTGMPAVLFVGRHEERKGLKYLIDAWKSSKTLQSSAQLWIAGSGPETDMHAGSAQGIESVTFLGRIDNEELFMRMRAAHVVVAPALYGESFGIVLLEAMAAHACVVASDIPGYRDVARGGHEARLVPPGDADALRNAIENILQDDTVRANMQSAGDIRAQEYSVHHIVDKYCDLYKRAISDRAAHLS